MSQSNVNELQRELGFASDEDVPIAYMQRTRTWYAALGNDTPYRYAHYGDVPFTRLKKPLAESIVTFVTTAAPFQPDKGPQGPGAPYNAAAKFFTAYALDTTVDHDLRIAHVGIDRKHTSMVDFNSWLPLQAMRRAVSQGRIGRLAKRFHGVPTRRSHRQTQQFDIPEVLRICMEDEVDAVLLVPNCPICHQSLSMLARALEEVGLPTVVMGCAKDIVEHIGVPRFLFSDFPLGNSAGRPLDRDSQDATLEWALRVLESAPIARTTVQSPLRWDESSAWKLDYCNVEQLASHELERLRAEFGQAKDARHADKVEAWLKAPSGQGDI